MTESEALEDIVESGINLGGGDYVDIKALKVAAKALEDVQQYRAIGTVEELQALKENSEPKEAFAVLRQAIERHRKKGFRESSWQCPFRTEQQCKAYENCKDCLYDKMLDIVAEAEAEVNRLPEEDWMT